MRWLIFLLLVPLVAGDVAFFKHYDPTLYTAPVVFEKTVGMKLPEIFFDHVFKKFVPTTQKHTIVHKPVIIKITERGFNPEEVTLEMNQSVVWVNERERVQALVLGVREISSMRSGFLNPGEEFSWRISQPGQYAYVDGVMIGWQGAIIVRYPN